MRSAASRTRPARGQRHVESLSRRHPASSHQVGPLHGGPCRFVTWRQALAVRRGDNGCRRTRDEAVVRCGIRIALPCGSRPAAASGWSNCAAATPGRRCRTSGCRFRVFGARPISPALGCTSLITRPNAALSSGVCRGRACARHRWNLRLAARGGDDLLVRPPEQGVEGSGDLCGASRPSGRARGSIFTRIRQRRSPR
jgi:hypothetical protein